MIYSSDVKYRCILKSMMADAKPFKVVAMHEFEVQPQLAIIWRSGPKVKKGSGKF